MRKNRLVLTLLWRDFIASIRGLRKRDIAWIVGGGGALIAYGFGIVAGRIAGQAAQLRVLDWLWLGALPVLAAVFGVGSARVIGAAAIGKSRVPFLRALPISEGDRRQTAAFAAAVLAAPIAILVAVIVAGAASIAGRPEPLLLGALAMAGFSAGFAADFVVRLRRSPAETVEQSPTAIAARVPLGRIDRRRPAWIGSWAWNAVGGRLVLSPAIIGSATLLAVAGALAAVAGFVRSSAVPAALTATVGGIAIFMLTLRCDPLASPVLRASALRFERALLGLVRLPLTLALAFFALLAGPAFAASPAEWHMPVGGGIGLLVLAAAYAVFAAYFSTAPRLARFAFVVALGIGFYESLEYGRTVLLGLVVVLIFLWMRAKRAYLHG